MGGIAGMAFIAAGALIPARLTAQTQGRISVSREIRYPTGYAQQTVREDVQTFRPPIPESFEARGTGAALTAAAARSPGYVRQYVTPDGRVIPAFHVRFDTGEEAIFVEGRVTPVRGIQYLALGLRDDRYYIRNLRTGEILHFRR